MCISLVFVPCASQIVYICGYLNRIRSWKSVPKPQVHIDRLRGKKKKGFVFVDAFSSKINRQWFGRVAYYSRLSRKKWQKLMFSINCITTGVRASRYISCAAITKDTCHNVIYILLLLCILCSLDEKMHNDYGNVEQP